MPDITYATIPDLTAASDSQVTDNILFETAVPDSQADSGYSSKKVTRGQLLAEVKEDIENIDGISDDVKTALLNCFAHVAWTDEHGQDYYDALEEALYAEAPKTLVSISAVYTQSGTVYDTDTLDSLKADLVVTATYNDSSTAVVTAYTLSGTLEVGTSIITVTYSGKTTTFNVTVSGRSIKVFNGKGTSGTSIVDNANRALSEMIPVSGLASISTANPNLTDFRYAVKFASSDTAVESTTPSLVPDSYTGTGTALSPYDPFTATTETLYAEVKQNESIWAYVLPTSNYIRLLFKKDSAGSSPITSLDGATIVLNGAEYKIVEKPASEFE